MFMPKNGKRFTNKAMVSYICRVRVQSYMVLYIMHVLRSTPSSPNAQYDVLYTIIKIQLGFTDV